LSSCFQRFQAGTIKRNFVPARTYRFRSIRRTRRTDPPELQKRSGTSFDRMPPLPINVDSFNKIPCILLLTTIHLLLSLSLISRHTHQGVLRCPGETARIQGQAPAEVPGAPGQQLKDEAVQGRSVRGDERRGVGQDPPVQGKGNPRPGPAPLDVQRAPLQQARQVNNFVS